MIAKGSLPQRELSQIFGVTEGNPLTYKRDRISEIRRNSEVGTIVMVGESTVHDLLGDIRFLLNVLDQTRAELGRMMGIYNEEHKFSSKFLRERDAVTVKLEQVKAERDKYHEESMNERKLSEDIVGEREQLYLEIEAKDKVLEWYGDDLHYHIRDEMGYTASENDDGEQARTILSRYNKTGGGPCSDISELTPVQPKGEDTK